MKQTNKWIAITLLVAILILLNIIAQLIPGQLDMTAEKVYTLSPGSRAMLEKAEERITLKYYFSRSQEGLPINFKNYASRVEELLKQYLAASKGKIQLEIIDPDPYSDEEEEAIRAGIEQLQLPDGGNLFFGLQAIVADQEQAIPVFDPRREQYLEYDISRLIYEVQLFEKPTLGLITSLDMISGVQPGFMPGQNMPQDWFFITELRRNFNIEEISGDEIPGEVDVLAVIHPSRLNEKQLFAIDQFVLSGKPALLAVDPSSMITRMQRGPQAPQFNGATSSDLQRLFRAWNIEYNSSKVLGDESLGALMRGAGGRPVRNPLILEFRTLESQEPVSAELNNLLFAEAGAITLKPGSPHVFVPLVSTTQTGGTMMANSIAYTPTENLAQQLSINPNTQHIAARISGKFMTAFPDGKPSDAGEDSMEDFMQELQEQQNPSLKESTTTSNIFVLSDTDFLANELAVEQVNFLGQRGFMLRNDNIALASNILEFLAGSRDLIEIRGKSAAQRPFEVVEQMRIEAEKEFRDQLSGLEGRQQEVRNKIRNIRQEQGDAGSLVASEQVREELEQYALEEQQIGREIRDIQRTLNEDINALNLRLAAMNILTVPMLLLLFGVSYFINRTRRQRD